ncbi:TRAP transporter substrate-binding protein DctP [Hoeflea alexandrii]|uniref:TRAP transporter substrate-binding protein n=1 Tax=Hoeflea alexandrii TaxID=288436 RepID=UPI0022AF8C85|nr:TRAP transporter substrate-binding protein DctP [Hoeflea alexandrii]MCZ4287708.1 TRAP transporter substrate-binding protein DctP [Hoeflea alexandrii]
MTYSNIGHTVFSAAFAAVLGITTAPALAQEKVTLKFADWMPVSHYTVANAAEPFMEKVKELSGGSIDIQFFPGGQLGKGQDALRLVQTGVADIADISPAYISDKFVLSSVAELPAMFDTACEGTAAFAELATGEGIIAENEFKPYDVRILVSIAYAPYKILTVAKKVETVNDFKGLKIRTAGGAMDMTANALEAVSVRMPGPDILASMSRGTLDGSFAPLQSVKVFDLQTVLKHQTTDVSLGSFITVYAISNRAWNSLSDDQRSALTEAGKFATKNHCEYVDAEEPKVIKELEGYGVEANSMADGELAKLDNSLSTVQQQWAEQVDGLGKPGSEVLAAFRDALNSK